MHLDVCPWGYLPPTEAGAGDTIAVALSRRDPENDIEALRYDGADRTAPVQSKIRVPLFAARTLNAAGQCRVTLSRR